MHLRSFLCLRLIVVSLASNVHMIRDYFFFKKVTGVAGFSCGGYEHDHRIVRVLNDVGISTSIERLEWNVNVSRFLRTDFSSLGVFLDLRRCSSADESIAKIFDEASACYMFEHLHRWLILGEDMGRIVRSLNDSTFSVITDFVVSLSRNDDDYVLYDIYNPCKHCGGELDTTQGGTWSKRNGLNITLLGDKFSRRRNFRKIRVKCAGLVAVRPANRNLDEYLRERTTDVEDNWGKFGYALMTHVAYMFNFTLEPIELNHWNASDKNGPLITGLERRAFDLGFFPSIIKDERLRYADVTLQVWPARTCFMFRTVPVQKLDMNIIFRPLERNVWYAICLLSIVTTLVLLIILKADEASNWGETVFIIVAAVTQQGLPFKSSQLSSRIVFLQTMIFGVILYNCYSAAIVSSRLNNVPIDRMNDSLFSLVKSGLKLTAHKDIFFTALISFSTPDIRYFNKHWETIPEEKRFQSLSDGIQGIVNPKFAYHADPTSAYPLVERTFSNEMICQLTEVHLLRLTSLALWSSKHGQFREITKIGLIRTYTAGIRKRELLLWSSRKPFCNEATQDTSSVTIIETVPAIFLLLFGTLVSVAVCVIENIVFRKFKIHREKVTRILKHNGYYNGKVLTK